MSKLDAHFFAAQRRARESRALLRARAAATKERLRPTRLLDDTIDEAGRKARAGAEAAAKEVSDHPVRSALIGAAALAWVFRRPLLEHGPDALRRGYRRLAGHGEDAQGEPGPVQDDESDDLQQALPDDDAEAPADDIAVAPEAEADDTPR